MDTSNDKRSTVIFFKNIHKLNGKLFQIEIQSKNNLYLVNVDVSASTEAFLKDGRLSFLDGWVTCGLD